MEGIPRLDIGDYLHVEADQVAPVIQSPSSSHDAALKFAPRPLTCPTMPPIALPPCIAGTFLADNRDGRAAGTLPDAVRHDFVLFGVLQYRQVIHERSLSKKISL